MPASGLKLRHRLASTDRQYRTHRTDNQKSDILQRLICMDLDLGRFELSVKGIID